jgi:tetrapyrrole methylase family protein/MazG family protein
MESTFTIFRTDKHPAAQGFAGRGGSASLDGLYAGARDFDALNHAAAEEVMRHAEACGSVVYAVPGQGIAGDSTVAELIRSAAGRAELDFIPGVDEAAPFLARCAAALGSGIEACAVIPAPLLDGYRVDRTLPLAVTQIDDRLTAGRVKLKLAALYGDGARACLGLREGVREIRLDELDRGDCFGGGAALFLPPCVPGEARYGLDDLVAIMDRLRGPGGCPWDREQTHETLKQYLLEETYETIDAIEHDNMAELCEELGDVLLQVVFHAKIASERGDFDVTDVADGVSRKMILRHPHIFGDVSADTPEQVVSNWEAIKKREKGQETEAGMMKRVPGALPALLKSMKVQGKAARVGFDWNDVWGAYAKLEEEVRELKEAIERDAREEKLADEFGDVLFAAVNVARFIKVHPEFALKGTVEKFIRRFEHVERRAMEAGRSLETMTLEEMDAFWNEAKAFEQSNLA